MLKDNEVTANQWQKRQAKTLADYKYRLYKALSAWDDFIDNKFFKKGIISLASYPKLKMVLAEVEIAAKKTIEIDGKASKVPVANPKQHEKSLAYCDDVVKWAKKKSKEMKEKEDAYIKKYFAFLEERKHALKTFEDIPALLKKIPDGATDQLGKFEDFLRKKITPIYYPKESPYSFLHPKDISAGDQSLKKIDKINKSVLALIREKRKTS
ncbi:MAG: hypothetical protein P8M80_10840 [Pirellulaceae bacterium]|nr:hypothetical protein [Pirellulaceae bacterium]